MASRARAAGLLLVAVGVLVSGTLHGCGRPTQTVSPSQRQFLLETARRTWDCLRAAVHPQSGLPADHLTRSSDGTAVLADYTTPTNIGLFLMALPAACDFGWLRQDERESLQERILARLEFMPHWHGHIANFLRSEDGRPQRAVPFYSSVDNAWLAAGLNVAADTPNADLRRRTLDLYARMDFGVFYDPEAGQLRLGFEGGEDHPSPYHYGLLCSEARIISVIAISRKQVPREHWFRLYRTLPAAWDWQRQTPRGAWEILDGARVFQGYYQVDGLPVVPSWGGSAFEFLMPLLVLPEQAEAGKNLGENNRRAVRVQQRCALEQAGYPVWGFSPCARPGTAEYQYVETGCPALGSKGYPDLGIVAPYASALAVEIDPAGVAANFEALRDGFEAWSEWGFCDAVDVRTRQTAPVFLALDQGMIFLSLHNYFQQGRTRKRFFTAEMAGAMRPLWKAETFYPEAPGAATPAP